MNPTKIKNATDILAEDQDEYGNLMIRREVIEVEVVGRVPVMRSRWKPTADEIAALMGGAEVELSILGNSHPPVILTVEEAEE